MAALRRGLVNPERWRRIDALLSAALQRPEAERDAFVARACGGDEGLRAEVERLLGAHQAANSFLEAPPTDASAALRHQRDDSGGATPASAPAVPGSVLGRYIILTRLGGGGMGVVYVAYDPQLDRKVALKLWRAEVAAAAGPDAQARLLREAQAMARVSHPNVIAVHDVGLLGQQVFIAMEFIDGCTLKAWLREKRRSPREIVEAMLQAGKGLAAAHAAGLVHRDFKPDNVLVARDGRVKVLDFGLARAVEDMLGTAPTVPPSFEAGSTPRPFSEALTRSGVFLGTPAYMAPEQLLGKTTDARTDQFSFCVTLHEALYGERPFGGESLEALQEEVKAGRLKEPDRPTRVPAMVRHILRRGLRADPSERYPSMEALLGELAKDPRASRRRALTVGAVVLSLAAITLGYRQQWRQQSQVCKGAGQKLAGVWDGERRGLLAAAFMGTGKPYAADALRAVQQALDAYARGWVDMHTEACEATRLRGEQSEELLDLRMGCLSDRRHELKSLVEIFSRADARVVERAPQAALGLTALSECANAVALKAPVPMLADAAVRASADELRQKLAQARATAVAGKYGEALPMAKESVARSQELHYPPLEAEALFLLGRIEVATGDFKSSEKAFRQSALAALTGRHDEALARAWIYLVLVAAEVGPYERGDEAARLSAAVLERLENADDLRATLFTHLGALLVKEGKQAEALDYAQRATEIWQRTLGPEHPNVADALNNVAVALRVLGRYQEAVDNYQRAAEIKEKVFGTNHPWVVGNESNLGVAYRVQGRYQLALAHQRRALEACERLLGPQHPWVARTLTNLGGALIAVGRYDEALAHLQRGLTLGEKTFGPEHLEVNRILANIGRALLGQEQYQPALEYLQRSVGILEKVSGPDHPELVLVLVDLARARAERHLKGDAEAALGYLRRALAIREKASGPENPEIAHVLSAMAQVLKEKEPRKALDYLERSRQIHEKYLPADSQLIPATLADMGGVYLRLQEPLEAKRVLERALQLFQSSGSDSASVARAQFLMARALWDGQLDRERALTLSEQARSELLKAGRAKSRIYREMEAWLSSRTPARSQR